jgi:phosphatidylserine/phosphatidylglycerophosphate/cardiolipin synthase-like enzyme
VNGNVAAGATALVVQQSETHDERVGTANAGIERPSMRQILVPLVLVLSLVIPACRAREAPEGEQAQFLPPIAVYFSPKGGCTAAVVRELDNAKNSVLVQAYSFTSAPIARALVDAQKRGVKIEVILDKSHRTERYSEADFLRNMAVPVKIDAVHAIAHNKIMVIDGKTVITGSFNFTREAEESNAENMLIIRDKDLADTYTANWQAHAAHSEVYEGRTSEGDIRATKQHHGIGAARPLDSRGAKPADNTSRVE